MWVFLLSEVMFFTGLIGAYVILRFAHPDAFGEPGVVLNVPLTAFNTFVLICSSVTMVKAFAAFEQGDQQGLQKWLLATILLGAFFVGVLCLCFTLGRARKGAYTAGSLGGVEIMGLYWHFVDLVWILLFTIVYLI